MPLPYVGIESLGKESLKMTSKIGIYSESLASSQLLIQELEVFFKNGN